MRATIKIHTARGDKEFPFVTRTLAAGTRLYRWIPEHDETWPNYGDHHWVRGMVFGELKSETLGGGLYVSENPFDWYQYGNARKLVIIELRLKAKILDLASMMHHLDGEQISVKEFANYINDQVPEDTLLNRHGIIGYEHKSSHNGEITLIGVNRGHTPQFTVTNIPRFEDFDYRDGTWLRATTHNSRLQVIHNVLSHIFNIHISQVNNPNNRLLVLLECVDYYDLLKGLSNDGRNFSSFYDFVPRWVEATRTPLSDDSDEAILRQIYGIFYSEELRFRSRDIIAGGGMEKNGTPAELRDTTDGQGYIRTTEWQAELLRRQANPFISITNDAGEITDPSKHYRTEHNSSTYALRYKYPGLHNYQSLALIYPSLHSLQASYDELAGALRTLGFDPSNMTTDNQNRLGSQDAMLKNRYGEFISSMLKLLFSAILSEDISIAEKYQKLMSLHPFPDGNGRVLRAFFRHKTGGAPLFMPTWDFDIFYPPSEFEKVVYAGIIEFYRIAHSVSGYSGDTDRVNGLANSSALWEYALRNNSFLRRAPATTIDQLKAWFRSAPPVLFTKKLVLDIEYQLAASVSVSAPAAISASPPVPAASASTAGASMPVTPIRSTPITAGRSSAASVVSSAPVTLFAAPAPAPESGFQFLFRVVTGALDGIRDLLLGAAARGPGT